MKPLEQIDPVLIDQAVVRVCSDRARPADREAAIAQHLAQSPAVEEWLNLLLIDQPENIIAALQIRLLVAVSIGLEVGYELGWHEATRNGNKA